MIGLSLTALWPRRRLACFGGALLSLVSLLMVDSWERVKPPEDWTVCKLGAVVGILLGIVVGLRKDGRSNSAAEKAPRTP